MANRILLFDKLAFDPATNQYFQIILIDGGTSFGMFIRDVPSPTVPGLASAISSVGAIPVIAPAGVGNVTGLGTTNAIPLWTNGPGSVLGDSLISQIAGPIVFITPTQTIARSVDQTGAALTGQARSTVTSVSINSQTGLSGSVQLFSTGATYHLALGQCVSASYAGLTTVAGGIVDSIVGFDIRNWVKSNETITECLGISIDNSFSAFAVGNTFAIKSTSTAPSNLLGSLKLGATASPAQVLDVTGNALISGSVTISGLTANSFLFSGVAGLLTSTAAPTNGQLLIGSTGAAPARGSIASADTTIVVTLGAGTIDLGIIGTKVFLISQSATPLNLTSANSQITYTNEGAAAPIVVNLPTAVAGLTFTFIVQDTDGFVITASAGDTIRLGASVSSVAGTATSTAIGSVIELVAINATEWIARSITGTWATA